MKQKTAYERRISDWSADVCSSDLLDEGYRHRGQCIAQSHAGVGKGGGIDHDESSAIITRRLYPFDQHVFGIGLQALHAMAGSQIGRASCGERVCKYV